MKTEKKPKEKPKEKRPENPKLSFRPPPNELDEYMRKLWLSL